MSTTLDSHPADERDAVLNWRIQQFEALGFDGIQAKLLATKPEADLARARRLIGAGCPADLALRILL